MNWEFPQPALCSIQNTCKAEVLTDCRPPVRIWIIFSTQGTWDSWSWSSKTSCDERKGFCLGACKKRVRKGRGARCQYTFLSIWPWTACHLHICHPPPHLKDVGHKRGYLLFQDRNEALTNHVVDQAGKLSQLQPPGLCLLQLLLQLFALYPLKVYGALACPDPVAVLHSLL